MSNYLRATLTAAAILACSTVAASAYSDSYGREIVLVNKSSKTITEFFASNIRRDTWEEDMLGDYVLRPGETVRLNMDDGTGFCLFDFKATFTNGTTLVRRKVNICRGGQYTITG